MAFIQAGDQPPGGPFMTVSFKMDITTSGTHNGLFITTGIQNAQGAQMKQFGFVQPQGQLLGGNPLLGASQLSLAPVGFTPQPTAIESGGKVEDRLPTAASIVDIVDEPPPTSSHQQDPNASFVTTSKTSGFSRETSGYSKETSGYSREQTTSTLPPATSSPSVFSPEPQRAPAFVRTVDQATSTTTHERHVEERRSPPPFATTTTFRSFADEKKRQTIRSPQPGAPTTITVNETLRRSDERKERTVVGDESGSRLDFRSPDFASPTPSFVNRQADEFLRNIPIKINTFEDDARSVAPYVQHPTDFVLNDTTTTTTTVEVFRANAEEPVDFYKLPPGPLDDRGGPQLIRARGPGYEVHSNTETRFGDTPLAHWANEPGGLRTSAPFSTTTNTKTVQWDPAKPAVVGGGGEWASDEEADGELAPTIAADPLDTRVFPPRTGRKF
ncbi:hypothetical protein M3Y99_00453000 [Aphelenchoides fujianensis]|nr:hypothetical protein M3Y99_00453000 [Aphelenchoides fujianensis]